jgi:hypothetical protein
MVRDRWSALLVSTLVLCSTVAAVTLAQHGRVAEFEPVATRTVMLLERLYTRPFLSSVAVVGCLTMALAAVRGFRDKDVPLTITGVAGLATVASVAFGTPLILLSMLPWLGGRYVFLPWVLAMWTLILLLDRGWRAAIVPLAGAALIAARHFAFAPLERYDWAADAECLEVQVKCDVTVNPEWRGGLPGRGPLDEAR